ncbi:YdcF family protein [Microvirga arsenatis]|uniref:YdcF family protein n=1 Tax=Microvirga arsenatis TaxID=2692265 RepID=A0ABW9Z1A3_9HYPH|nr:YdcF family protein [Microvirga arsenatis]NBJ10255.1 YdcF family protein [Microvirga arsenatis]NBJ24846.1 YdcF family protein [Microvirga arsenatis]
MDQNTPRFTPQSVAALNNLAAFLAMDDFGPKGPNGLPKDMAAQPVDCVILAGNCVLETAEGAFRALKSGVSPRLLITGGIGHATEFLCRKIATHPVYRSVATEARTEAHMLADIAERFWGIDRSSILIEPGSANSGENARFSRRILEDAGLPMRTILLVQDPTMQRRADATFRKVWSDQTDVSILNWPTFTPRVCLAGEELRFDLSGVAGLWSMDRFLSLVMGEIPRLRDDPHGYGPRGTGFIMHVDIPEHIEADYAQLKDNLAGRFVSR